MEFEVLDENYVLVNGEISLHTSLVVSMGQNGKIMIGTLKQIYEKSSCVVHADYRDIRCKGLGESETFRGVFQFLSKIFIGNSYPIITSEEMKILFESVSK